MSTCPWPAPHGEECSHRDRSDRSWSPRLLPLLLQGKSQSGLPFIELINLISSCVLVTDQGYLHKNQISLHF